MQVILPTGTHFSIACHLTFVHYFKLLACTFAGPGTQRVRWGSLISQEMGKIVG